MLVEEGKKLKHLHFGLQLAKSCITFKIKINVMLHSIEHYTQLR